MSLVRLSNSPHFANCLYLFFVCVYVMNNMNIRRIGTSERTAHYKIHSSSLYIGSEHCCSMWFGLFNFCRFGSVKKYICHRTMTQWDALSSRTIYTHGLRRWASVCLFCLSFLACICVCICLSERMFPSDSERAESANQCGVCVSVYVCVCSGRHYNT